jgi:DNA-binding transcriptional MocR family regulator
VARVPPGGAGHPAEGVFPEGVDGDRLATLAEAREVLPPGPKNFVRLASSYASPSEIVEGVRRLAHAFAELEAAA